MNKIKEKLKNQDIRYFVYTGITAVLVFIICVLLSHTGSFWKEAGSLFSTVMLPIFIGLILTYLLSPVVNAIQRRLEKGKGSKHSKRARHIAVLVTYVIVLALIAAVLAVLIFTVTRQIQNIDLSSIFSALSSGSDSIDSFFNEISQYLSEIGIRSSSLSSILTSAVSSVTNSLSSIFFGMIFSIYFLSDSENISAYWKRAAKAIMSEKAIAAGKQLAKEADQCFSGYIRGQAIDALLVGVVSSAALSIAGIPYGLVIGLIVGFGNLIPYVGPLFGYASVILICLVNQQWTKMIIGLVILALVMFIDGNIVNPKLLANSVQVHPLLVIASLLAGGAVGGILGMLMAVPLGAFLKLQFDKLIQRRETAKNMLGNHTNQERQNE